MGTKTPAEIGYRPEIDGLRSVAVLSVIFYHAGLPGFGGGYVGVDIFFVISGFLITSIIAREISQGTFTFAKFYERRIRRILPALFFVSSISSVLAWLILSPEQLKDFGQSLVATMGFVANVYFYLTSGYFSPNVETLPMIHMWSLAVEEQFYLLFPVLLLIIWKLNSRATVWILVILFNLSLALCLWNENRSPVANFYLAHYRAWELLIGAILALRIQQVNGWFAHHNRLRVVSQLAALLLIVGAIALFDSDMPFPGKYAVVPVFGTALLLASFASDGPARRLLSLQPMVMIGLISYSAYLWHQPLFAFARVYSGFPLTPLVKGMIIVVSLVAAWFSWRFVEKPFRDRAFLTRNWIFVSALAGSSALSLWGLTLHISAGFPQRFTAQIRQIAATMETSPMRNSCHTEGVNYRRPQNACIYSGTRVTWALFGDSHTIEIGQAVSERLALKGEAVVHLTFSGCPPMLNLESQNPGCSAWTREAANWLVARKDIKNVLLVYRHNFYLFGDQTQVYPELGSMHANFLPAVDSDMARRDYWTNFDALVTKFLAAGKSVYIVAPIPELPTHIERYIYGHDPKATERGFSRAWNDRRGASARANLEKLVGRSGVTLIDPVDALCGKKICHMVMSGKALFFDDNHPSMHGARLIVKTAVDAGKLPL